ncbi:MAG: hypothetical protein QM784_33050 [Polyangiaceae bacterium]
MSGAAQTHMRLVPWSLLLLLCGSCGHRAEPTTREDEPRTNLFEAALNAFLGIGRKPHPELVADAGAAPAPGAIVAIRHANYTELTNAANGTAPAPVATPAAGTVQASDTFEDSNRLIAVIEVEHATAKQDGGGAARQGSSVNAAPGTAPTGLNQGITPGTTAARAAGFVTNPPVADTAGTPANTTTGLVTNPPAVDAATSTTNTADTPANTTTGLVTNPPAVDAATSTTNTSAPNVAQSPAQLGTVPVMNSGFVVWMSPWGAMLFPVAPLPPSR